MTPQEELALLDVLGKAIKEREDWLKGCEKDSLMELHQKTGADRKPIMVKGRKVGIASVAYAKPRPAIVPGKEAEACEYLRSLGLIELRPVKGWEYAFAIVDDELFSKDTGEAAPQCFDLLPERPKGVTIRVDKDKAVEAMRPMLQGMSVAGLLEG